MIIKGEFRTSCKKLSDRLKELDFCLLSIMNMSHAEKHKKEDIFMAELLYLTTDNRLVVVVSSLYQQHSSSPSECLQNMMTDRSMIPRIKAKAAIVMEKTTS